VKKTRKILFFILVLSCMFACKKILERPSWNTNVTAPLIKTSLNIGDIIKDTAAFRKNSDKSISIVENKLLYSFGVDSIVKLKVDPYIKNVKLASLKLDSQVISRRITLGEIAHQLMASSNSNNQLIGYAILSSQGQVASVPSFGGISAGPFGIDISQYFVTANLLTGHMEVKITNGLPLDIQTLSYNISNSSSGTIINSHTFSNLTSGTTQIDTANLAGKTVEGNLNASITNMDVNGGTVLIDTNNAITVRIAITNITVSSATAVFPAQEVVNDHNNIPLVGMGDMRLTKAIIRSGTIDIKATSTIAEPLYFMYSIPAATFGGVPGDSFFIVSRVPPHTDTTMSFDISGYDVNLTGENHDTVNKIFNRIIGTLKYTGKVESLSLTDSVKIEVSFSNIKPSYIQGYFGRDTIDIGTTINPESVSFDLFNKIESGTLTFEKVKLSVVVKNGIGVDGIVSINKLTATNKSGAKDLYPLVVNHPIPAATDNPLTAIIDTINLSANTNAIDLINLLPDKISYAAQAILNPSGNTGPAGPDQNFAYFNSSFEPYLQLELPLSMIADNLVLSDTTDFNGADHETAIKDGNFTIQAENGFPLSGDLKLYFLDAGGLVLDTLVSTGTILPAPMTGLIVSGKAYSKIPFHVNSAKLNNILHSKKVIFKVKFSTLPENLYVKIYSDYEIDFKLVGEFDYHVH
jgi:hypothetical protein